MKIIEKDWFGRGAYHIKDGDSKLKLPLVTSEGFPIEHRAAARRLAESVANTVSPKNKFKIKFDKGSSYHTDGKVITLSDAVLEENKNIRGIELFSALAAHEAAHIEWTDFKVWHSVKNPQIRTILNVLEDERIEMLISENTPGYTYLMRELKLWAGEKFLESLKSSGEENVLYQIFAAIMFPTFLNKASVEKYEKVFEDVYSIVAPLGKSTEECLVQATNLYEYLKGLTEKEEPKDEESKEPSPSEGGEESPSEEASPSRETLSDESFSKEGKPLTTKSLEDFLTILEKINYDGIGDKPTKLDIAVEGYAGEFMDAYSGIVLTKPKGSKIEYSKVKSKITSMAGTLKKAIEYKREGFVRTATGLRSGSLDVNKLTEAVQGVQTIYKNVEVKKSEPISVLLLIDESGSMCVNDRYVHAKECAILINEALKGIPGIEYFVYGHTADTAYVGSVDIRVYKETGVNNDVSLSGVAALSNNRDGYAILEVAKRVRKQTKNRCLMIVLSDGSPSACNYSGIEAEEHTKECVEKVEKMQFQVLQVSIDGYNGGTTKMFKNVVKFKDLKTLPKMMANLIKRII
jgi:hypothetical protein